MPKLEWSKARLEGKIDWIYLGKLIFLHDSIGGILTGLSYDKTQSLLPFLEETKDRLYNKIREVYRSYEKEVAEEEERLNTKTKDCICKCGHQLRDHNLYDVLTGFNAFCGICDCKEYKGDKKEKEVRKSAK